MLLNENQLHQNLSAMKIRKLTYLLTYLLRADVDPATKARNFPTNSYGYNNLRGYGIYRYFWRN